MVSGHKILKEYQKLTAWKDSPLWRIIKKVNYKL
jgi:hypothetical protein